MTRIEITLGLLATIGAILVMGLIGATEEHRMAGAARSFTVRSVERGAKLFDGQCARCHGANAAGLMCPPLNQLSGLHGGKTGIGIAWRLEEMGWERTQLFEYVVNVVSNGRNTSSRAWKWKGNRGIDQSSATVMAMPPFAQANNGPLRPDQVRDIATYILAFEDYLPADPKEAKAFVDAVPDKVSVLDDPGAKQRPVGATPAVLGEYLFKDELACATCHSVVSPSTVVAGPNLSTIWATADERIEDPTYTGSAGDPAAYITESIRRPGTFVVKGFVDGLMPVTFGTLPDADVDALVAYLSQGQYTPLGATGAVTATGGITATIGSTATVGTTAPSRTRATTGVTATQATTSTTAP